MAGNLPGPLRVDPEVPSVDGTVLPDAGTPKGKGIIYLTSEKNQNPKSFYRPVLSSSGHISTGIISIPVLVMKYLTVQ